MSDLRRLKSDTDCADAIGRCGEIDRDLKRIAADKDAAVAAAARAAEDAAEPLIVERQRLEAAIRAWCEKHRDRLTDGGRRKTAPFPTGECAWRKSRDTVDIDEARKDRIIAALKRMGDRFRRFVKVSETVSKTAIAGATDEEKARLKRVAGISFRPGAEGFSVSPVELPLAERPAQEAGARSRPNRGSAGRATGT